VSHVCCSIGVVHIVRKLSRQRKNIIENGSEMNVLPNEYDGFFFLPYTTEEESGLKYEFFRLPKKYGESPALLSNSMGDMYHIIFVKESEDGNPEFDDTFCAILADPVTYVNGLVGANIFGCIVRKTEKSTHWVEEYLTELQKKINIKKMTGYLKSIAESR
jgi:hypothetical protein